MKVSRPLISVLIVFFVFFQRTVALASSEVSFEAGYRQDAFKWSIAGPDNIPNVLSEIKFKKLQLWQVRLSGRSLELCNFYVRYSLSYGKIFAGKTQDSDYFGENRTREFSRSYADAGRGEVFDTSVSVGYMLKFPCGLNIAPLAGTSYHMQNLQMYNGRQVVNGLSDFLGKIKGLNSTYKSRWEGPWLGADLVWQIHSRLSFLGTFEYHWAKYHARGDWNLRSQFLDDFKHKAHGHGTVLRLGVVYQLSPRCLLSLTFGSQSWTTAAGSDTIKILESLRLPNSKLTSIPVEYRTKLNKVEWTSYEIMLGIAYCF